MEMQKRNYKNEKLNIEINNYCFIDEKNEIWFRGKEIALILEYKDTKKAIQDHIHQDDKKLIDFKIKQNPSGGKMPPEAESCEITRKCFFYIN